MIKEVRKIENRSKSNYIRQLQQQGLLTKHINAKGYVCYDPEELKLLLKSRRVGRPLKIKGE